MTAKIRIISPFEGGQAWGIMYRDGDPKLVCITAKYTKNEKHNEKVDLLLSSIAEDTVINIKHINVYKDIPAWQNIGGRTFDISFRYDIPDTPRGQYRIKATLRFYDLVETGDSENE